jgi:hypothetical protein
MARAIINVPSDEVQEILQAAAVDAIEVDNPMEAAERARDIFEHYGYTAKIYDQVERELPKGFMVFLVVPALNGITLLFWPNHPDPEAEKAFKASGVFGPWTAEDGIIE